MKRALALLSLVSIIVGCAPPHPLLTPDQDPRAVAALVARAGGGEPTPPECGTSETDSLPASAGTGLPARKPTSTLNATINATCEKGSEVLNAVLVVGGVVLVVGLIVGVVVLYGMASGHQMPAGI